MYTMTAEWAWNKKGNVVCTTPFQMLFSITYLENSQISVALENKKFLLRATSVIFMSEQ